MKKHPQLLILTICFAILLSHSNKLWGQDSLTIPNNNSRSSVSLPYSTSGWKKMDLTSTKVNGEFHYYTSTSELDNENPVDGVGKYASINLIDNDLTTAWVEGVEGNGKGEYAYISIGQFFPDSIMIRNGYQKSQYLFQANSRVERIKISFYTGFSIDGDVTEIATVWRLKQIGSTMTAELKDTKESQKIKPELDSEEADSLKTLNKAEFPVVFQKEIQTRLDWCDNCSLNTDFQYFIKIELVEAYPGAEWNDVCISELEIFKNIPEITNIPEAEKILNIYQSEDLNSGLIYMDTEKRNKIPLLDKSQLPETRNLEEGESLELVLMDVSEDMEWAMINVLINQEGEGKVEEYSLLMYPRRLLIISDSLLKTKYGIFGFVEKNGKIWLDTIDGMISLEDIKEQIMD